MKKQEQQGFAHWVVPIIAVVIIGGIGAYIFGTSHAATCRSYTFAQGSSGQCVKDIQGLLNYDLVGLNSSKYLVVDGQYGPKTRDYVKLWQGMNGLPTDGVVGPQTWNQVCNAHKGPPPAWWTVYSVNAGC